MKYLIIIATTVFAYTTFSQSINSQLFAHYKFEGDLLDETSNGNDLSIFTGSINYGTNYNNSSNSIVFDGNSNVRSISTFDNSTFTNEAISVWIKGNTISSQMSVIVQGAFCGFGVYSQETTGKAMGFFDGSSASPALSNSTILDNSWHHIVIQNNGSETFMYVDAQLISTITENLSVSNGLDDNRLFLGMSNLNQYQFTGEIDELRIYSRVLTQCEINYLYNNEVSVFQTTAVHYPFENNINDQSLNSNDLIVSYGTPQYVPNSANISSAMFFDKNLKLESQSVFDNSLYTQESISIWVKTSFIAPNLQVLIQGAYCGFGVYINDQGNIIGFFDGSSTGAVESTMPITDNNWHHIVVQNNGLQTELYIDNLLISTISEVLSVGNGSANNKLYLGNSNTNLYPFNGTLDDVKIFDKTLCADEIDSLFQQGSLSINENSLESSINVFPNPSNGTFNVNSDTPIDLIEIYSLDGKLIQTLKTDNENLSPIKINNLTNGTYLLKIIQSEKYSLKKIIVN